MSNEAPVLPASDDDRARTIELLRSNGIGLRFEELERRLDSAVKAQTVGELAVLVWDLQGTRPPSRPETVSVWHDTFFRFHSGAYGLVNGLLVGTWALTGHHFFWPFFPIAGWGVGLGMHGMASQHNQRRRIEREQRKALHREQKAIAAATASLTGGDPATATNNATGKARYRPGPADPAAAVRDSVVVMFADIVDSTRLTSVIGDEDWIRVRGRCRELLQECYEPHAGHEVNTTGDGFLIRFAGHSGAVRCAIEIQQRLHEQRRQVGFAPTLRIGIHSGDAMNQGGDLLGTVVNTASRVTAEAQPSEILTTEAVAEHLDDRFYLEDGGLRSMKGLERPVHVLSVVWKD